MKQVEKAGIYKFRSFSSQFNLTINILRLTLQLINQNL